MLSWARRCGLTNNVSQSMSKVGAPRLPPGWSPELRVFGCLKVIVCNRVAYEAIEVEIHSSLPPFEYLGVSHKRFSLFNYNVVVLLYFGICGEL